MHKLDNAFYDRPGVVTVARDLLGKVLVTEFDGRRTSGRIVEVEAYNGVGDRASHAWSGRRTRRTEVMFGAGGTAYVYLIYGIHHLFNVVTNKKDIPHAVLIRALEPMEGIGVMRERLGRDRSRERSISEAAVPSAGRPGRSVDYSLTRGPGNLSRALGLRTVHTGASLLGQEIWIGDDGYRPKRSEIIAGPRIGVDYAGVDAGLPYRFYIKGSPYVSGPKTLKPR
jgi:DNA-3-methyladenine glycosylase